MDATERNSRYMEHEKLANYFLFVVYRKLIRIVSLKTKMDIEDIRQICRMIMLKSFEKWNPEKGSKVGAYVGAAVKWQLIRLWKRMPVENESLGDIDVYNCEQPLPEENIDFELLKGRMSEVLLTIPFREREVIEMRVEGLSFTKIGKTLNISGERVRQIYESAVKKLRHPERVAKLKLFVDYAPINGKKKDSPFFMSPEQAQAMAEKNRSEKLYAFHMKRGENLMGQGKYSKAIKEFEKAKAIL